MSQNNNDIESLRREVETLKSENAQLKSDFDQFIYVVSHDFNAPLRGISNLVNWIKEDLGVGLTEQLSEYSSLLQIKVEKMRVMLDGLLELSRISRKNLDFNLIEPDQLIPDLVREVVPGSTIKIKCVGNCPPFETFRSKLQETISQVISNAIRFHHSTNGNISVEWKKENDFLVIKVTDDGPGFSPDLAEKVFLPFFSLHPEKNTAGIGLSLVEKIASYAGGAVSIQSEIGKGTVVTINWPIIRFGNTHPEIFKTS